LRGAVSVRESAPAMFGAAEREVERLRDLVKRLEDSRCRLGVRADVWRNLPSTCF